jgi:hypothetical protein
LNPRRQLQQISELKPVQGIDIVGPLPNELQKITVFSAGIASVSKEPEAGRALIKSSFRSAGAGNPYALANNAANLQFEFAKEALDPAFLCRAVFGINTPSVERFLGFELDDRHPLSIVRDETLVRNVAGHRARKLAHALGHRAIFVLHTGIHSAAN